MNLRERLGTLMDLRTGTMHPPERGVVPYMVIPLGGGGWSLAPLREGGAGAAAPVSPELVVRHTEIGERMRRVQQLLQGLREVASEGAQPSEVPVGMRPTGEPGRPLEIVDSHVRDARVRLVAIAADQLPEVLEVQDEWRDLQRELAVLGQGLSVSRGGRGGGRGG